FITRPLISEGIYAAITPAATVLPVVSRNWRRAGFGNSDDKSLFDIDLLSSRGKCGWVSLTNLCPSHQNRPLAPKQLDDGIGHAALSVESLRLFTSESVHCPKPLERPKITSVVDAEIRLSARWRALPRNCSAPHCAE